MIRKPDALFRLDRSDTTVEVPLWWMEEFCRLNDQMEFKRQHDEFIFRSLHDQIVRFRRYQASTAGEERKNGA